MNKHLFALVAFALFTALTQGASAQDYGSSPQQPPPPESSVRDVNPVENPALEVAASDNLEYSQRGITLPAGTLRADATFGMLRLSIDTGFGTVSNTATFLSFGAAFGVMDNLEVGVSGYRQGSLSTGVGSTGVGTGALPFQLTDDFNFGLVTPYARYRLLHDEMMQLAAELSVVFPTASGSDFGLRFGVPFRLMLAQMIAIDTGLFFQTTFADSTINNLTVPLGFVVNVMPALFLLARMHFTYSDFDVLVIGADFGGGYTIEGSDGQPMVDLIATFGFPTLLVDGDTFTELWQVNVGVAFRLGT